MAAGFSSFITMTTFVATSNKVTPKKVTCANQDLTTALKSNEHIFPEDPHQTLIQCSQDDADVVPFDKGLVHIVIGAYNNHFNLVLRPDDVWQAIVTQLSFYVNAH